MFSNSSQVLDMNEIGNEDEPIFNIQYCYGLREMKMSFLGKFRVGAYFFDSQVSDRLSSVANQAPRG